MNHWLPFIPTDPRFPVGEMVAFIAKTSDRPRWQIYLYPQLDFLPAATDYADTAPRAREMFNRYAGYYPECLPTPHVPPKKKGAPKQ